MFELRFWKKLTQQTISVAAATAAGLLAPLYTGDMDLKTAATSVALAAAAVVLKGLAASFKGDPGNPNFTGNVKLKTDDEY